MLKWFLFHTRAGDWLLALLERWAGLAVVDVTELDPELVDDGRSMVSARMVADA